EHHIQPHERGVVLNDVSEQLVVRVPELRKLEEADHVRQHLRRQRGDPLRECSAFARRGKPNVEREERYRNGEDSVAEKEEAPKCEGLRVVVVIGHQGEPVYAPRAGRSGSALSTTSPSITTSGNPMVIPSGVAYARYAPPGRRS